ncbi:MAG TPA: DUF3137 domain-containing protein [Blastocatellia bacterium]|jgi:hypothetical protein
MGLLKRVFGPGHNEVWEELSNDIGAKFTKGGFFKGSSRVEAKIENWIIELDTFTISTGKSSATYTRARARFISKERFHFTIYRKGLLSAVGKFLGMQDVEVGGPRFERLEPLFGLPGYIDPQIIESGDPGFDEQFIIKGNDEQKIRALFKRVKIRDLIQHQPSIMLQIRNIKEKPVKGKWRITCELYFQETGVIKDKERLKRLFELFAEMLKAMRSLNIATQARMPKDRRG